MQRYVINFFIWWYGIQVRLMFTRTLQWTVFILEYTNTLTMAKYINVPLFQDMSRMGRMVGFVIRGTWVWFGGMLSIIMAIPVWLFLLVYALLPLILLLMVLLGIISIFTHAAA